MTLTFQSLGLTLITAGLMSAAHASPVVLSAVIDFDEVIGNPLVAAAAAAAPTIAVGTHITNQYAQFGLEFTGSNSVNCSRLPLPQPTDSPCTAPLSISAPPHPGRNFLMNVAGDPFGIKVLDGFSLNSLTIDIARNATPLYIKFFDVNDALVATPFDEQFPSDFRWTSNVDLGNVGAAVRRIEFGGNNATAFAIDYMSFNYVVSGSNVPEPAMLSMVGLALAGLGLSRRRRA